MEKGNATLEGGDGESAVSGNCATTSESSGNGNAVVDYVCVTKKIEVGVTDVSLWERRRACLSFSCVDR